MALLEETFDEHLLFELLVIETQSLELLGHEIDLLKTRVMARIPALLEERRAFSDWQSRDIKKEVMFSCKSKRLQTYILGIKDEKLTLGRFCLLNVDDIMKSKGMGPSTFADCLDWLQSIRPQASSLAIRAFYGRSSTKVQPSAMIWSRLGWWI